MRALRWTLVLLLALVLWGCDDAEDETTDTSQDQAEDQLSPEDSAEVGGEVEEDAPEDTPDDQPVDLQEDLPEDQIDQSEDLEVEEEVAEDLNEDIATPEVPLAGFGTLTGECGVLDEALWSSSDSFIFVNTVDFADVAFDVELLSPSGMKIYEDGTIGGSSEHSEAISADVIYRCELGEVIRSEAEVEYSVDETKKTDYLDFIDDRNVAVSVTRAFVWDGSPCQASELQDLLERKLSGALEAESNAAPVNAWDRSILSVLAIDDQCAQATREAYDAIDAAIKADTILYVTVTEGLDDFIY